MAEKMFKGLDEYVKEFQTQMEFGIRSIHAAACVYAEALRRFPTNGRKSFAERFPKVGDDTWRVLELIGKDKLVPEAYMMNRKTAVMFASLPLDQQTMLVESKGVCVVSQKTMTEIQEPIPVCDLTPMQAQIVIDASRKRIRSVNEQMELVRKGLTAWSGNKKSKVPKWEIKGSRLVINRVCTLTLDNLRSIIATIEKDIESK